MKERIKILIGHKKENIKNATIVVVSSAIKKDNPELLMAQRIGVPIFSFPEFIANNSIHKQRIVIAGSHGKTTITSMILHVLQYYQIDCDYMVGAQLQGFNTMVKLTDKAPIIVLEGDEYLSSPIDRRPKLYCEEYSSHMSTNH